MLRTFLRICTTALLTLSSLPALGQSTKIVSVGPSDRPAVLQLAGQEQPWRRRPLVVVLHGYGMDAASMDRFVSASATGAALKSHILIPEGRLNPEGKRFWDATDACCDFYSPSLSDIDAKYVMRLIHEVQRRYRVEHDEIYLVGFSNGAFLANRLACEYSEQFAGFASLSGANYLNPNDCRPRKPISMLQVHGTLDPVIAYNGGQLRAPYPSAADTAEFWADHNRCRREKSVADAFELSQFNVDFAVAQPTPEQLPQYLDIGPETDTLTYSACRGGEKVGLWTMKGLGHAPLYKPEFLGQVLKFLGH